MPLKSHQSNDYSSSACTSSCSSSNWARFHSSPALSFCTTKASSDRSTFWPDITWKIQAENGNADGNQVWEYWNLPLSERTGVTRSFFLQLMTTQYSPPPTRPLPSTGHTLTAAGSPEREVRMQRRAFFSSKSSCPRPSLRYRRGSLLEWPLPDERSERVANMHRSLRKPDS